jgi:alpha-beta hydrolase superfamily lysophospholipase
MDATDSSNRIAGYVIMAGNTRPMEDLISEQTAYILGLDGEVSDEEQQHLAEINKQVQQVKSLQFGDQSQSLFGAPLAYWSDLAGYQPHEKAKSITEPVLILHGDRDYQVTAKDFANWRNSLSDRANVELKSYPNLNHLMIEGSGPSQPEEYAIPGHVAAEVINDIAQWIIKQPAG